MNWWSHATEINFNLSTLDIIFGVINGNELQIIDVLNYCMLSAKYFISVQKRNEKDVDFYLYQIELKNRLEVESVISTQTNNIEKFNNKWELILNNL